MLVLRRKPGETIELPELGISFTLVELSCGKATIGVVAPRAVQILRGELVENPTLPLPAPTHRPPPPPSAA